MALKRLLTDEMLHVSGTWIDPKSEAHKAIMASGDLAPSMDRLTAAHNALAAAAQPTTDDPRLREISEQEGGIDLRHDDIIRGTHALLTGASYLLGAGDGGDALIKLRDTLIPDGLDSTQKSYRAEAGQAAQLKARLSSEIRTQLQDMLVGNKGGKKALSQFIDEWIKLGKQLGELEDEKDRLQPAPAEAGQGPGAVLVAARNKWIRIGNAFVANGEAAELDIETDKLIFAPLRAAEKAADRRGRGPRAPDEGPGTGSGGGGPAAGTGNG